MGRNSANKLYNFRHTRMGEINHAHHPPRHNLSPCPRSGPGNGQSRKNMIIIYTQKRNNM